MLDGRGLGEEPHRALGGDVGGGLAGTPHQPGRGGDVDDGAAAGLPHGRDRALRAQEHALGVDGHDAIPVGLGHLLDLGPEENAGIVDEHAQLAIGLHGRGHGRAPVRLASHVQVHVGRLTARAPDLRLHLLAVVVLDIPEHDRRSFSGEHPPFQAGQREQRQHHEADD